ncbi:MAG: hypothetical protein HUU35_05725, partial [Armatimonadetes bacterium]|nr:hypothetical protein [Armatimonadota bacterium]
TFSILWPTPQPDSMTYFGYPEASNPEVFGQRIAKLHEQGFKAVPYSCLSFFSEAAPEWPFFATSWQTGSADTSASDVAAYNAAFARINPLSPTYSDFIVAKNMEFMKRYDLDGFYHDNVHPYPIGTNVEGGGWVDAKGVGHAVYPILAYRDLHRRLYAAVKTERSDAHLMAHMSGKVTIPFLAYEDSYLDGEHFRDRVKDSYLDLLPLDTFRAEFMGRQWGLMPYFLPEFRGEYARQVAPTRGLMGLLLIHDVQPWNLWCNAEVVNAMFRALDAFGYVESRFVPYFDPRPPARTALPNVQVSAYLRDGRALLVVANLDREPKQGVVTIDAGRLGLPLGEVVTWPECQPVQRQGSDLTVSMEGLDYRLLLLGPAP